MIFLNRSRAPLSPSRYRKHGRGCETDWQARPWQSFFPRQIVGVMPALVVLVITCGLVITPFRTMKLVGIRPSVQGPFAPLNQWRDPVECMHFHGEGNDGVGPFILRGACNTNTGVMTATKTYMTHEWKWCGMVTPFGMAGVWRFEANTGWWWIWQRERSNHPATSVPD